MRPRPAVGRGYVLQAKSLISQRSAGSPSLINSGARLRGSTPRGVNDLGLLTCWPVIQNFARSWQ